MSDFCCQIFNNGSMKHTDRKTAVSRNCVRTPDPELLYLTIKSQGTTGTGWNSQNSIDREQLQNLWAES